MYQNYVLMRVHLGARADATHATWAGNDATSVFEGGTLRHG
jgi:hypothetical protein